MLGINPHKEKHSLVQVVYNTEVLQLLILLKLVHHQQMIEMHSGHFFAFTLVVKSSFVQYA